MSLPFKSDNPHLGDSYASAESRFLSLERRFRRDAKLARDYADLTREYMDFGHTTLVDHGAINLVASNTHYIYLYVYLCILICLLWLCKLSWDEPLSGHSLSDWHSLCNKLSLIGKIVVPRCIRCNHEAVTVQLHGFSDASERGFGCCVYVRVIYQDATAS